MTDTQMKIAQQQNDALKPHRLCDIHLEMQGYTASPTSDLEIERQRALHDLRLDNTFALQNVKDDVQGPYRLSLKVLENRLHMDVLCTRSGHVENITLALSPFKRLVHDYKILCDNFYETARLGQIHKLETIDMGRKSIHDEAAETLIEAIENKVKLDKPTARRLFTLVYVLHIRDTALTDYV